MKLKDIAERLDCRLEAGGATDRDPSAAGEVDITRVAGIEAAGPGDLTFLSNPQYAAHLTTTRASAVIVSDRA